MRFLLPCALLLAASACTTPLHKAYDYGRAYQAAFDAQSDLSRPSVQASQHALNGIEAFQIRLQVVAESTDKEAGQITN